MAEFKVDTSQLRVYSNQIEDLQRQMNDVAARMTGLQIGSVLQIKASSALIGRITDCKWATINQASNLGKLARGLDDVADLYDRTENNLKEPKTAAQAVIQDVTQTIENVVDWDTEEDGGWSDHFPSWGDFLGWLGRKSVPFSVLASLYSFSSGDAKGVVSGLKNLTYAIGNGAKAIFNTTSGGANADWFQRFMGFNAQGVTTLGDSWQKFLDSMNLGKQTTTAGKVAVVAKWAGYGLTIAGNVLDNVNEYQDGGMTVGRAVGETVVESAVDIGLSIGAGVLIAAALPATAPAIVVGAVGAGVVWVGNEVCEYITGGRDIGEVVADAVCDTAEWIGDRAEDIGNAVQDFGESVADGIGNALSNAGNWVCGLFG